MCYLITDEWLTLFALMMQQTARVLHIMELQLLHFSSKNFFLVSYFFHLDNI